MKLIDLTGKRFERLTAVRVSGHKPVKWECVCDCGNVVNVSAGNLTKKTNSTRSCGCLWASDIKIEVGQVRESNSGKFEVVELLGGEKVLCRFEDGNTVVAQKRKHPNWQRMESVLSGHSWDGICWSRRLLNEN